MSQMSSQAILLVSKYDICLKKRYFLRIRAVWRSPIFNKFEYRRRQTGNGPNRMPLVASCGSPRIGDVAAGRQIQTTSAMAVTAIEPRSCQKLSEYETFGEAIVSLFFYRKNVIQSFC